MFQKRKKNVKLSQGFWRTYISTSKIIVMWTFAGTKNFKSESLE